MRDAGFLAEPAVSGSSLVVMARSRVFAVLAALTSVLLCYDLLCYLKFNRSFLSRVLRPLHASHVDLCFDTFLVLLSAHNFTGKYFLLEPKPPIPVTTINGSCRQHLIPKPPPPWLKPSSIACYRKKSINSAEERARVRRDLLLVKKRFERHRIPLLLYAGSLIGSWRHHNIIPYDDDFDFRFPLKHKYRVKKILRDLSAGDTSFSYRDTERQLSHLQLKIACRNRRHCLSFIDFFFFWPGLRDTVRFHEWPSSYPRDVFFPTIKRPMEGQLYDALHDFHRYYKLYYTKFNISTCVAIEHNKSVRQGCKPVRCDYLNSFLPFMVASESPVGRIELVVNSSHIQSIFFQKQ